MKKQKVVILNITHGDHFYCDKPHFLPIAAGACRSDITNDACGEDNISNKNRWYGDFTSIYWAWKNLKNVDIIGTSHYRRYLSYVNFDEPHTCYMTWEHFCANVYSTEPFIDDLKECDFIMPYPIEMEESLRDQYTSCHPYPENIELVSEILKEMYPNALPIWEKYMSGTTLRYGFLFITTWNNFNELCKWLYPILQRCEERLDLLSFTGRQERVIAYLYERLVPVFIDTYGKTVKSRPMFQIVRDRQETVYMLENNSYEYLYERYKRQYTQIRSSKAYRLGKFLLKPLQWVKNEFNRTATTKNKILSLQ